RARHVDERHVLLAEWGEQLRKVVRGQIRAGDADLRVLALAAAMANEDEDDLLSRTRPRGQPPQRALDVGLGRLSRVVRPMRRAVLAEPHDRGIWNTKTLASRRGQRLAQLREL